MRLQLEELGYRSHYFSFSLFPGKNGTTESEMASDLYLCMRIGKCECEEEDGIFGQADIDPNMTTDGNMTFVGFTL